MFFAVFMDDKSKEVSVTDEKTVDGVLYWKADGSWIPASFLEYSMDAPDDDYDDWGSDNSILDHDFDYEYDHCEDW